jgi:hypothetical protein
MLKDLSISILRPLTNESHLAVDENGRASAWGIDARVELSGNEIQLSLSGSGEAIITVWVKPQFTNPLPLIPGFMMLHNRPDDSGPGYPQMTKEMDLNLPNMRSPFWGIRADRATAPVIFLFGTEGMRALSVPPYVDGADGEYVPSGIRVCMKRGIGVSFGFFVEPVHYVSAGMYAPGYREYFSLGGETQLHLGFFSSESPDRRQHAAVIKTLYERDHEIAPLGDGIQRTVQMLADAMANDVIIPSRTKYKDKTGGELFKIANGNMARILMEIGWTGGAMAAFPFLATQQRYQQPELQDYAVRRLDRISDSIKPESGFFWDCQLKDQNHVKGWWSGEYNPPAHYAYTQGHACYYMLKSALLVPEKAEAWITAARKVLDRALSAQMDSGRFPTSFTLEKGEPLRLVGFSGCWFAAALAYLYEATKENRYLDAAIKAVEGYHREVADLTICGGPLDTLNVPDQEGNLALMHASAKLHEITGDKKLLGILQDSADCEMLWRYYYNARQPCPPLDTAEWGSSGGSVTSTQNPHIHPMQLNSLDQVLYLYDQTGETYYEERTKDAIRYGCCCVCRESEDFGWGKPGWLCERFCPSDGCVTVADSKTGNPRSVGNSYHPWTVAVTLEGLTGNVWDRFPELR